MKLDKYINDYIDKKTDFSLKLFLIGLAPLVPTIILFTANLINEDYFADNLWINHVLFWIFTPIILWSLFATQKNELVGSYGETILLLIPTFIWLLAGQTRAISWMILIAFVIIMIGASLYFSAHSFRYMKTNNEKRLKSTAHIFVRLAFVFSSVVATITISFILINWADHSMKWGYTYDKNGDVIFDKDGNIAKDFTQTAYVTFIAVTTIIDALLLVSLGLLSSFNKHFIKQNDISATQAIALKIKPKRKSFLEKSKIIKLPKDFKKRK